MVAGLDRWVRTRRLRIESAGQRLTRVMERTTRRRAERLAQYGERLDALSPLGALRRGFAVPLGRDGRILRSADAFTPGDAFDLRVTDGSVPCRVEETWIAGEPDG
jgi:exodeoxyribonuclease VII large subunit